MNKWIDAEWLCNELGDINMDIYTDEVKEYIEQAPSIDVIRCRECKYWQTDWNPEEGVDNFHFCPMVDGSTFDDWFCADGEREGE